MADGKLLKAYTKLDSYDKKLALVQEYQHQYFSTANHYEALNNHEEATQGLFYFVFKIMCIES